MPWINCMECGLEFAHDKEIGLNVVRVDFQGRVAEEACAILPCCPQCSTAQIKPRQVMVLGVDGTLGATDMEVFEYEGNLLEIRRI